MKIKKRKIEFLVVALLIVFIFLGCTAKNSDKKSDLENQIQDLQYQNSELHVKYLELEAINKSLAQENNELFEIIANCEKQDVVNSGFSGCNDSVMRELNYLLEQLKTNKRTFPIRDEDIETEYPEHYNQILIWFDELSSSYKKTSLEEGRDCIFDLIKIEKASDTGTMQFDKPKEAAEFFKVYYLILEWDENYILTDINTLDLFHNGSLIMVHKYKDQWEVLNN